MINFQRARCRICNSVASADISSETGETHHKSFVLEKNGLSFVCSDCEGHVNDMRTDYMIDDDEAVDTMFYTLANTWNQT